MTNTTTSKATVVAYRDWLGRTAYVSALPGKDGADYEYAFEVSGAVAMTPAQGKKFAKHCEDCNVRWFGIRPA